MKKKQITLSYNEVVKRLVKQTGIKEQDINLVFDELQEVLISEISKDNKVDLNFSLMELRTYGERGKAGITIRPKRYFMDSIKNKVLYNERLIIKKENYVDE